jgi:chloramphenicol 3-O phosphotransferase
MKSGKAILLNGASSAGKTSITKELQTILNDVYYNVSIDQFFCNGPDYFFRDDPWMYYTDTPYPELPAPNLEEDKFRKLIDSFPKIVSGFHNSIEALLRTGNNVIIDHGFHRKQWMHEFVKLLYKYDVYMIGIFCNPAELEKRERKRGDRPMGMAAYQSQLVHRDLEYDLVINTERLSAIEAAARIKDYVEKNVQPNAIKRVMENLMKQ